MGEQLNILVIEDDILHSTDIMIKLSNLGFETVTLIREAKKIKQDVSGQKFDMVFCDLSLPDTDGIELLADYLTPDVVKGVVVTSAANREVIELAQGMCSRLGYSFVTALNKPFSTERLSSVIGDFERACRIDQYDTSLESPLSEREVMASLNNDRVTVVYQPQYDFRTGVLVGVEALVRMYSGTGQLIPPSRFLPVVSAMGLDKKLFLLVLEKSISEMSSLKTSVQLSININPILLQSELCDFTLLISSKYQYPLERLTFEITEEAAYDATSQALANLARLKLNGVSLSIDDFGTGYASLEQLVDLPFSELKIDRVFISTVKDNYRLQQLTQTMLHLARSLNMTCIAEGVEDEETWQYLKEIGVDVCQGFYTGKPMNINDLSRALYLSNPTETTLNSSKSLNVVVVDENQIRGESLSKALNNELEGFAVLSVSDYNELERLMVDKPVELVIASESLYSLHSESCSLSNEPKFIVLYDKAVDSAQSNTLAITRQVLVSDTAKAISNKVKKFSNAKLKDAITKLSERELQVARLLVAGFTNKHISFELGINQKTVSTYKTRVLDKLGVKTTLALAESLRSIT